MATPQLMVGSGLKGLLKDGYKEASGLELAMLKNIEACCELGKVTRTSMGPNGMNKLLINHLDKTFVTNNAGTILGELEVVHPAAKMIVLAAKSQEEEYGDYSNFVVTFASELLKGAKELLEGGIHPADIIVGYSMAADLALKHFNNLVVYQIVDKRNKDELKKAVKSVVCAKQHGYEDLLVKLVSEVCVEVMAESPKRATFSMDNIRVSKLLGGALEDSTVLKGLLIKRKLESQKKMATNAKIAVFGTSVEAAQTETKGTVQITSAEQLLNYNKSEESLLESQIKALKDCEVDVIVSGGSVSEMALHFIDKYEMLCIKISSKFDLKRLCKVTGGTPLLRLGAVLPEELGFCEKVFETELSGTKCTVFETGSEHSKVATVVLKANTQSVLDDFERAVIAGCNCVKTLCGSSEEAEASAKLVYGGGCSDVQLSEKVREFGEKVEGTEQFAVLKYAESINKGVPSVLSENCGRDPNIVVTELIHRHKAGEKSLGIDVESGDLACMKENFIYDTFEAKLQALRLASDVALTILRIDQLIMSKQAGGPKLPPQ